MSWVTPLRTATAVLVTAAAAALLIACRTPLDRAYGRSYRDHVAQTIANAEAGQGDLEARRPDGISTDAALYKYRTQETKVDVEEPEVVNVDLGG